MDLLVIPLQERMEDWKRTVVHLDKEHSKGYWLLTADSLLSIVSTTTILSIFQRKIRENCGPKD